MTAQCTSWSMACFFLESSCQEMRGYHCQVPTPAVIVLNDSQENLSCSTVSVTSLISMIASADSKDSEEVKFSCRCGQTGDESDMKGQDCVEGEGEVEQKARTRC